MNEAVPSDRTRCHAPGMLDTDPLADQTVAALLRLRPGPAGLRELEQALRLPLRNGDLLDAQALAASPLDAERLAVLQAYFARAGRLPEWADAGLIELAGAHFRRHGSTCSIVLFCASLPEVYAYSGITEVLHSSQRLEQQAEARIRSTAQLVLPIMLAGGLCDPAQSGAASVAKARLIHALVRHQLLRGEPAARLAELGPQGSLPAQPLPPQARPFETMAAHGWNLAGNGLPCNQREQAYVILCFSHVLVRSLRRLGLAMNPEEERACFHAWNVVAHLMGVRDEWLVWDAATAQARFEALQGPELQARAGADPRPAHAQALLQTMSQVIPNRLCRRFPELLMRRLCDRPTLKALGQTGLAPLGPGLLFGLAMGAAQLGDRLARLRGRPAWAVESVIDLLGDRFITDILRLDLAQLRSAMGKNAPARWHQWLRRLLARPAQTGA